MATSIQWPLEGHQMTDLNTQAAMSPTCNIPAGFCQCGCGEKTAISKRTDRSTGRVKGQPFHYLHGHGNGRNPGDKTRRSSSMVIIDGIRRCQIPLSRGMIALCDPEDYERLARYNWTAAPSSSGLTFYAITHRTVDGKPVTIRMHREILGAANGVRVDHRDLNGLHNWRTNLRIATGQQNSRNRGRNRNNSSGFKGVHWEPTKRKWIAQIDIGGKKLALGGFSTAEQAARAYDVAALTYHGEFAYFNFPKTISCP